jgi:septal ring factor EnvC (AmiA/AmiB activator)
MVIDREKIRRDYAPLLVGETGTYQKFAKLVMGFVDELDAKDAEIERLKICPVCDEKDPDGLEACSKCYCEQIKDGEIFKLKKEIERLKKLNLDLLDELDDKDEEIERLSEQIKFQRDDIRRISEERLEKDAEIERLQNEVEYWKAEWAKK